MSNLRFCTTNLLQSASYTTISSQHTVYVKPNLWNDRPGKPCRWTDVNGSLTADFGSAASISFIAIMGHNLSGASATLQFNTSDSWGSPAHQEGLTITETNLYKIFNTVSYRYARLWISGNAASIQIGELFVGKHIEIDRNYKWGLVESDNQENIVNETEYGQVWSYHMYNYDDYELSFRVPNATFATISTLFKAKNGSYSPFCIINQQDKVKMVRFDQSALKRTRAFLEDNRFKITLKELPLGKDI